ncbi:hypothetical protein AMATHDRAFT_138058, partial [Amanita thiersii Skay4041]
HSTLRTRVSAFQNALLQCDPPIRGLDHSIVIDPRRLHLTLGVMSLNQDSTETVPASSTEQEPKMVADALKLLQSLEPSIASILQGRNTVKIRLDRMDILKPERDGAAHVLYLGPSQLPNDEEDTRLQAVSGELLVHQSFKDAGYITETRPLKLHCTILNTSHRRPRSRLAFSYSDILSSTAMTSILTDAGRVEEEMSGEVKVRFGIFNVGSIELWEMGSHGENNEYVSCGGIRL